MQEFFNDYVQNMETYIMFRIKETVAKITPELTAKGRAPIALSMGAPTTPPPKKVIDALKNALDEKGAHLYSTPKGEKYLRDNGPECLEITWNDGTVRTYSAETGELLSETQGPVPDESMDEEYTAGDFLIRSPLHGDPEIYDRSGEKLIAVLHEDAYLAFATQTGEYLIAEFIAAQPDTASIQRYGLLLNRQCETLAKLPYLCDILPDGTLIFDDNHGVLRQSRIYSIEELMRMAHERVG